MAVVAGIPRPHSGFGATGEDCGGLRTALRDSARSSSRRQGSSWTATTIAPAPRGALTAA
jgi:hypothetical protein